MTNKISGTFKTGSSKPKHLKRARINARKHIILDPRNSVDDGWMFMAQGQLVQRAPKLWLGMKDVNLDSKIVQHESKISKKTMGMAGAKGQVVRVCGMK